MQMHASDDITLNLVFYFFKLFGYVLHCASLNDRTSMLFLLKVIIFHSSQLVVKNFFLQSHHLLTVFKLIKTRSHLWNHNKSLSAFYSFNEIQLLFGGFRLLIANSCLFVDMDGLQVPVQRISYWRQTYVRPVPKDPRKVDRESRVRMHSSLIG